MLVKRLDRATMPTLDASRNTGGGPGKAYETFIATRPIGHILVYGTPRPGCHGNRDRLPSRANVVARHAAPLAYTKHGASAPHAPRPRSSIKKRLLLQAAEAKSLKTLYKQLFFYHFSYCH